MPRTVIEAARSEDNKFTRRQRRRKLRRENKRFCRKSQFEEDYEYDEPTPVLERKYLSKRDGQLDNLGPADRWMRSQCGRPWNDVYAELSVWRRSGNVAISHVVDTHMIEWVQLPQFEAQYSFSMYRFFVDQEGILRENMEFYKWKTKSKTTSPAEVRKARNEAKIWLQENGIIARGTHFYWATLTHVPMSEECIHCRSTSCQGVIKKINKWYSRTSCTHCGAPYQNCNRLCMSFRQGNRLSAEEIQFFLSLPDQVKKEILKKTEHIK